MSARRFARLEDRGAVAVTGADAAHLLQGLVTNDMDRLGDLPALHAGLLTPQGKLLFAFFIVKTADGFLLETARTATADLAKRLGFYRLRAKAEIRDVSDAFAVFATWPDGAMDGAPMEAEAVAYRDPRAPALGQRVLAPRARVEALAAGWVASGLAEAPAAAYHAHRIECGVAEFGLDFVGSEVFPHEANFDRQAGVDFRKGCFVGQEVVARMQHKTIARKRFVTVHASTALPSDHAEITAGPATLGRLGSIHGVNGLALVRLDRAIEMRDAGHAARAGGVEVTLSAEALADFERVVGERAAGAAP